MRVLIDGEPVPDDEATISVFDWVAQRGYGCFELLRSYAGVPFRLSGHLDRLEASLAIMGLEGPDRADVGAWIRQQAAAGGDCLVRCLVTAGSRDSLYASPPRTVVLWEEDPDLPDNYRVLPLAAPWHAGGDFSELTGAKTLSYAPNMAATLAARAQGFDDALLVSRIGHVLEGPTFTIAWVSEGVLETPSLDLGLLKSITRQAALEAADRLGLEVREGRFPLARVRAADEVIGLSTTKEVSPVTAVGDLEIEAGPVTAKLANAFADLVAEELAAERAAGS